MKSAKPKDGETTLRERAEAWLNGKIPMPDVREWETGVEALAILYKMANLPATSSDALKLLHELQVHQIELTLQNEELERAHADLIAASRSERERYEFAPVGHLTINRNNRVVDINQAAAKILGADVPSMMNGAFDALLTADSRSRLRALLGRLPRIGLSADNPLHVMTEKPVKRRLQLIAKVAVSGDEYCIAMIDASDWVTPEKTLHT